MDTHHTCVMCVCVSSAHIHDKKRRRRRRQQQKNKMKLSLFLALSYYPLFGIAIQSPDAAAAGPGEGITNGAGRTLLNAGNPDAKRLYDDLLSNYNKLVRPVVNTTDPLTVRIKLKLSQLIDVVSRKKEENVVCDSVGLIVAFIIPFGGGLFIRPHTRTPRTPLSSS